ncbi:MAG: hypothetical protein AAB460_03315 [Patescibacteria group bacterium]
MDIQKFLKPGKDIVIEMSDGIDYLIDDRAAEAIQKDDEKIDLMRLYDHKVFSIDRKEIESTLLKSGVDDYLDKRTE